MSDNSIEIVSPGEINVITANLISSNGDIISITAFIADITIYEDVFSNTMSGYILLEDAVDLINTVPLIGQELFEVELKTPALESTIKKTFYIYKLQNRVGKKRSQTYMLNFCSKELIVSSNTAVSRSYSGLISDTVVDIFKNDRYLASDTDLNVDATINSYKLIVPYWTPLETINWLVPKSLNKYKVPNYLFYETNKAFEFMSLNTLIQRDAVFDYIYADVDANTAVGFSGDINEKYRYVLSIETPVTYDYLRDLQAGVYASKMYTLDITTRSINAVGFDYFDEFVPVTGSNHLNEFPLKNNNLIRRKNSSAHFVEKNNFIDSIYEKKLYDSSQLRRNSLLGQLQTIKLIIEVHGRTDIKVGDTINFKINRFAQITEEEFTTVLSDYYTGKYLITAIRHQILSGVHKMYMEIVKDSFTKKLTDVKL